MKKRIDQFSNRSYFLGVVLGITALILMVAGSYAAYVNFNVSKNVVTTGKEEVLLFSSNYLYPVNRSDMIYRQRRISPTDEPEKEGYVFFTVQIYNYAYGNIYQVNPDNIAYQLSVKLSMVNENESFPSEITSAILKKGDQEFRFSEEGMASVTDTLTGMNANTNAYTILIPKSLKDLIKIQLLAEPVDEDNYRATNNQKLAVILSMRELSTTSWSGKFIDENVTHNPEDYDAWNYEIKGNGQGQLSLIWNPQVLEVSSWFLRDIGQEKNVVDVVEGDTTKKKISFPVGGLDQPEAYQLQLYRAQKDSGVGKSWSEMNAYVTVSFEPIVNGE